MRPAMKSNNRTPKLANEPRVSPAEKQQHAVDIVPVADRQQLIAPSLRETVCDRMRQRCATKTVRHHHDPNLKIGQHFVWVMVVRCGE